MPIGNFVNYFNVVFVQISDCLGTKGRAISLKLFKSDLRWHYFNSKNIYLRKNCIKIAIIYLLLALRQ